MKLKVLLNTVSPDAEVCVLGDHGEHIKVSSYDYTLPGHPEPFVVMIPDTHKAWARVEEIMGETLEHIKEHTPGTGDHTHES